MPLQADRLSFGWGRTGRDEVRHSRVEGLFVLGGIGAGFVLAWVWGKLRFR